MVGPGRAKWTYRYTANGKTHELGLGAERHVSLSEAREAADRVRKSIRDGQDPRGRAGGTTFQKTAESYLESHKAAWGPKHAALWISRLRDHAYPHIGSLPVGAVDTASILRCLEPIWVAKTETAIKLRSAIASVLDAARARGLRDGPNPAAWAGHLAQILPPPRRVAKVRHHPAVPWREIPGLVASIRRQEGVAARALEFLLLTAARSGEVRHATWNEIHNDVWVVPAGKMKARRPHRVPLSKAALDVLKAAESFQRGDGLIFPGLRHDRPLHDATLKVPLRMAGRTEGVHGLRSSFRDWVGEATDFPGELAEMALAHQIGNTVQRAYARGDALDRRRDLMQAWATYCFSG